MVGAPRYFAKFGQPKKPEDLAGHNCLAFTFRDTRLAREWRFAQAGGETVLPIEGTMSLSDGAAVCDAARAGYGLAQLQDFFIDALIARGQLVPVLEKFKPAAAADLAGLPAGPASVAEGARVRRFHGREDSNRALGHDPEEACPRT